VTRDERELTSSEDDDRDDESVDTHDTSHDDWDDRLDDGFGFHDGDGADTEARLSGSVGGSEVAEYQCDGDSHESEE
jgi:hypothetical protein